MLDTCAPGASTIQISNIRASTHLPPKGSSEDDSGLSTSLLISLIAITVLLLLAIFILIFFCFQRKRPAHKMKKNSSEYAAKGHPIVCKLIFHNTHWMQAPNRQHFSPRRGTTSRG